MTVTIVLSGTTEEIGSFLFFVMSPRGQGKYCFMAQLLTFSPTNFANVNDPLSGIYTAENHSKLEAV